MKVFFQGLLAILVIEGLHFLLLTGALCGLGFFILANGETPITFRGLLWTGVVSFWLDGYGPTLLLCLVAAFTWGALDFYTEKLGLEKRRENLDQEVYSGADKQVAELRPKRKDAIEAAFERDYAMREHSLLEDEQRLETLRRSLDGERRAFERRRYELHEREEKVETWKRELHDLRLKAADDKERRLALKQRIRWAHDALATEPSNTGLALRNLRKAEKD